MKAMVISIGIHLIVLSAFSFQDVVHTTELHSAESLEIKVTLKIEDEIRNKQSSVVKKILPRKLKNVFDPKKIVKIKKKSVKKKPVQAKSINKQVASKKSISKNKEKVSKYVSELKAFIENHKFYPRKAARMRQHGVVQVKVRIDRLGNFKEVHIVNRSQFEVLNNAAKKLVSELKKFKPLPDEYKDQVEFQIPISYNL